MNAFKTIVLVLLAAILVGGCATTNQPVRITVMTYNIFHGEDAEGGSNLDAVSRIINTHQPDLVALQEVDNKTVRAKGLDLTAELAKRTSMEGIFGKAMDYSGGGYGEAVLCRLPVLETRNHLLPHTPNAEPRAALEVKVQLPNGEHLLFVGTHLDHQRDSENRLAQAAQIKDLYEDSEFPVILAGDLNATPEADVMEFLLNQWSAAGSQEPQPTYPATEPDRKIDYILFKPAHRWRVVEAHVIDEKVASDHCPFLAVLELLPDS